MKSWLQIPGVLHMPDAIPKVYSCFMIFLDILPFKCEDIGTLKFFQVISWELSILVFLSRSREKLFKNAHEVDLNSGHRLQVRVKTWVLWLERQFSRAVCSRCPRWHACREETRLALHYAGSRGYAKHSRGCWVIFSIVRKIIMYLEK